MDKALEAILWRWGSGEITLGCDDEGHFTMLVEHAEAQNEFFMADSPEAVLTLAVEADKKAA